jgi:ATP-dependent Clp protease adaptor protein ClpS
LEVRVLSPALKMVETGTPTKERIDDGLRGGVGKPVSVVVLNDNHNTFDGVAFALASVIPGVDFDRGLALANRIHSSGRATVWSGHRETAELYWTQLKEQGLTMAPLG